MHSHHKPQYDTTQFPKRIIKPAEADRLICISSSERERRVLGDPNFPKKIKLGNRAVGFLLSEVEAYIDHLIAASRSTTKRPTGKPEPVAPRSSGSASGELA